VSERGFKSDLNLCRHGEAITSIEKTMCFFMYILQNPHFFKLFSSHLIPSALATGQNVPETLPRCPRSLQDRPRTPRRPQKQFQEASWCHGTLVPWYQSIMAPWYPGGMVACYQGTTVIVP